MSIFSGTPITATTSSQTTTQTPKWLQDAIYNQIQTVQNVGALPFQQYTGALSAGPTANQTAAWQKAATDMGAWKPLAQTATSGLSDLTQRPGALETASPLISQALQSGGGLAAAQPYINQAGQSSANGISQFMNPYTQNVTDRIAQLGARNLSENLLPSIGDQFVRAGQFGGSRMGEFASRALRDTQDSILGQQAEALQSGFGTALGAAQGEQNRQLQLGQLTGQLGGQQQDTLLQGGQLLGNLANTDLSNRTNIYGQLLNAAGQQQQLSQGDINTLSQTGEQQRGIEQQGLEAMYNQYLRSQAYPQAQTQFTTNQLGALAGLAPSVQMQTAVSPTGVNPSDASQIMGGLAGLAGLFS